ANPCRCGNLEDCTRGPQCSEDYLGRISAPLMDRFDLRIEVPSVAYSDLDLPESGENSAGISARVSAARAVQDARFSEYGDVWVNADAEGDILAKFATPDTAGRELLLKVAERFGLSARGYHRVLRVARTIADLDGSEHVLKSHVAEAVSFRIATKG
ncbi:MAG TPA: AAA family ATPase, partial [Rhodobacteraceae bacterium]|nr:AAA family ATPase [Paracoccaceae bacterium]